MYERDHASEEGEDLMDPAAVPHCFLLHVQVIVDTRAASCCYFSSLQDTYRCKHVW